MERKVERKDMTIHDIKDDGGRTHDIGEYRIEYRGTHIASSREGLRNTNIYSTRQNREREQAIPDDW